MVLIVLLGLPLLGGVAVAAGRGRPGAVWTAVGSNGAALALGVALAVHVVRDGP